MPEFCGINNLKSDIMKKLISILFVVMTISINLIGQATTTTKSPFNMKLNAGILTEKLTETKAFYTEKLGFGVTFENEFYLLLHTPNHESEISFLLPNHPSQQPFFHPAFQGQGVYLTIEVKDVDGLYADLKAKGVNIEIEIRDEPWGDRHFAIKDPNGIGIDLVRYTAPTAND